MRSHVYNAYDQFLKISLTAASEVYDCAQVYYLHKYLQTLGTPTYLGHSFGKHANRS